MTGGFINTYKIIYLLCVLPTEIMKISILSFKFAKSADIISNYCKTYDTTYVWFF